MGVKEVSGSVQAGLGCYVVAPDGRRTTGKTSRGGGPVWFPWVYSVWRVKQTWKERWSDNSRIVQSDFDPSTRKVRTREQFSRITAFLLCVRLSPGILLSQNSEWRRQSLKIDKLMINRLDDIRLQLFLFFFFLIAAHLRTLYWLYRNLFTKSVKITLCFPIFVFKTMGQFSSFRQVLSWCFKLDIKRRCVHFPTKS